MIPIIPRALDYYAPLNTSRPYIYVFETEYWVDPEKYFFPIYVHHWIVGIVLMSTLIAADTSYIAFAFHACAMFQIAKYEMENTELSQTNDDRQILNHIENHRKVVHCIELHKRAIKFGEMIESTHYVQMFAIMLPSVLALTTAGLQTVVHMNHPTQAVRFGLFFIGHISHVFFYIWNSQNIIDENERVQQAAYDLRWYTTLDKTSKLLTLVLLRSSKPCIQTAGKIFPLTLMNFTVILKTSMSYFTVLSNFQ